MTARLPIPGGDDDNWGTILNSFLEVSLNADGTMQTAALTQAGGEVQSNKAQPSGYASLNSSGLVPTTQLGSGTASSSTYLRGDGSWMSPNGGSSSLASDSDVTISSPSSNQVLTYNSTASKWENEATVNSLSFNGGSAQTGAVSVSAVQVAGDISGTAASPLVITSNGAGIVTTTSNQTIGGTKTFSSTIAGSITGNAATATTASTVTTNANLTGDVTSVGNATTLTSSSNVESIIAANSTVTSKLSSSTAASTYAPIASPTFTGKITTPALQVTTGAGTANQVLTSDSSGNATWVTPASVSGAYVVQAAAPTGVAATDTSTIQTALNAASTAGGGAVNLAAGTYIVNPLVLPGEVVLNGQGVEATTVQLTPGTNADLLVTTGFSGYTGGSANGPQSFGITNLTLDANGSNQTALSRCFTCYGYNYVIDNVWMINGYGGGAYSEWGGSTNPMEAFWRNVKIWEYGYTPASVGLDWNGPHDSQFTNVIVATLQSGIAYFDADYGATPINGSSATFPSASTSFTFATTTAAAVAQYPTSGGSFVVPLATTAGALANSPTPNPTWTTITYTACSTTSNVTTFTGCTAVVGTSSSLYLGSGGTGYGLVKPSYGNEPPTS